MIRPFKKAQPRKLGHQTRRKGQTQILTDTPVKARLEAGQRERGVRKRVRFPPEQTPRSEKQTKKNKKKQTVADDDDTPCALCGKRYNEPPAENWAQCSSCKKWFHESCYPDDTDMCYTCLG